MARDRDDRYSDSPDDDRGRRRRDDDDDDDDRGRGRRRRDDDDYDDRPARRQDIPNYLVPSILVTLFCCLIGGIVAIVNAAQVNGKMASGDFKGARASSEAAKMWCWISFGIGLVINIIVVIAQVMLAGAAAKGGKF